MEYQMRPVARIRSEFPTKFGIPRQSGLADTTAELVFEPEFRSADALRGLEGYSHLWLLWVFSESAASHTSLTVRPPRLGGNRRMGVFATRSPFRPNPIGLSSVRLLGVQHTQDRGTILRIGGADLLDGTPILDIKPYLPFTDAHPEATGGFSDAVYADSLAVSISDELLARLPENRRETLRQLLEQDPRPHYQDDPNRVYGFPYAGFEIRFTVREGVAEVLSIQRVSQ